MRGVFMTKDEMITKLNHKIEKELTQTLKTKNKCVFLSCTGSGKTTLLAKMTRKYKNVLFVYLSDIIKITATKVIRANENEALELIRESFANIGEIESLGNVDFMSYKRISMMEPDEINALMQYDLIIMDEVNRAGAKKTKAKIVLLMQAQQSGKKKAHIVGATATPYRMDGFDVVHELFQDNIVKGVSLHEAISMGLLHAPYYFYCTYNSAEIYKSEAEKLKKKYPDTKAHEVIDSKILEAANILNMPTIIKNNCNKYAQNHERMSFVVFFSSFNSLNSHIKDVEQWFKKAYPKYNTNVIIVTSETVETSKNVEEVHNLPDTDNTITLIACIDMLTYGTHIDGLTGIIMYRSTQSATVYLQQLGRALSAGSDYSALVFDVVDNLHRKAVYRVEPQNNNILRRNLTKVERAKLLIKDVISEIELDESSKILLEQFINNELEGDDEKLLTKHFFDDFNKIEERDLKTKVCLASHEELIRKTVAEITEMFVKQIAANYFRI